MTPISSSFGIHFFVTIYILINIVHGDPGEVSRCNQRIRNSFGNCNSATECLRYSIKTFVCFDASAMYNVNFPSDAAESSEQGGLTQLSNEQMFAGLQGPNQLSDEQMFAGLQDPNQLSDEQMFTGLQGPSQLFDEQIFAELGDQINFSGLRDFIEADSYIADQDSFGQHSGQNDNSRVNQSFIGQPSSQNGFRKYILDLAKEYHYTPLTINDGKDYETLYHQALHDMIIGMGAPNRENYCHRTYPHPSNLQNKCMDALVHFGITAKSAIQWAFRRHTLDECMFLKTHLPEYVYIYDYMVKLSQLAQTRPSTAPIKFCEKLVYKS